MRFSPFGGSWVARQIVFDTYNILYPPHRVGVAASPAPSSSCLAGVMTETILASWLGKCYIDWKMQLTFMSSVLICTSVPHFDIFLIFFCTF